MFSNVSDWDKRLVKLFAFGLLISSKLILEERQSEITFYIWSLILNSEIIGRKNFPTKHLTSSSRSSVNKHDSCVILTNCLVVWLYFCIKRRDSRNTIYGFDFRTCWLNSYVNPACDWMLSLENLYFCVFIT